MNRLLSNYLGIFLNVPALFLNVDSWLFSSNVNLILTLFISLLAIIWWLMKLYDQYLIIRKRKQEYEQRK